MSDLQIARETILREIEALTATIQSLGDGFQRSVDMIYECRGKVVVTGLGKSGIVGSKIAATLSSTGSPAIFLHPVEAMHGDLGIVQKMDVALLLSKSGETKEVVDLLQHFKRTGMQCIGLSGAPRSTLASHCDAFINASVEREACPLNLAPTSSTIVAMALGDAISACLIKKRGFTKDDFSLLHPSGTLGHRLLLHVSDLMHKGDDLPIVSVGTRMDEVLMTLTSKPLGAVLVISQEGKLVGIFTDGDVKRHIRSHKNFLAVVVDNVMTQHPACTFAERLAAEAVAVMENRSSQISVLPVINADGHPVGILRLHDLVKAGF